MVSRGRVGAKRDAALAGEDARFQTAARKVITTTKSQQKQTTFPKQQQQEKSETPHKSQSAAEASEHRKQRCD